MTQSTSIPEILCYILASIFVGYSIRTPAFFYDPTSWITLGAAMGFALLGVGIGVFGRREEELEKTLPGPDAV